MLPSKKTPSIVTPPVSSRCFRPATTSFPSDRLRLIVPAPQRQRGNGRSGRVPWLQEDSASATNASINAGQLSCITLRSGVSVESTAPAVCLCTVGGSRSQCLST
eukprot:scaffold13582_cov182-Alexandrium_tamarense.AAC.7